MVLVFGGVPKLGKKRKDSREMRRDPILRNRQVGKLRLLVDHIDLWPMLPLKSMKVPMVHALAKSHINIYGLSCCWRACWGLLSMLPTEAMWMSVVQGFTRNHIEVLVPRRTCWCPSPVLTLEAMWMLVVCAPAWNWGDVHGLDCLPRIYGYLWPMAQKPHWYLGSVLPSRTMIASVAHTGTEVHVDVCGLYYHQRPYWCPWSKQLPETKWKSIIHVLANCKVQGSYFYSGINECRLSVERAIKGFWFCNP